MWHCVLTVVLALGQFAPSRTGELRVQVTDESGLPLDATVELTSDVNRIRHTVASDERGIARVRRLPFGSYRVSVTRRGFSPSAAIVEISSALPTEHGVVLRVAPVQAQIAVSADSTLLARHETAAAHRIGADALAQRTTPVPGREVTELVNTQPGWLLEANGILHPRGSEYQTQYIVDGLPFTDNRSPVYAPDLGAHGVRALTILTGGYPAEYGRKLGGIVEVVSESHAGYGLRGTVSAAAGSFSARSGEAVAGYGWRHTSLSAAASVASTDRYLDPPVQDNFTNRGSTASVSMRVEHDFTPADRAGLILRYGRADFLVPNERVQQEAGQRQDRNSAEAIGQFSYRRVVSPAILADTGGSFREVRARLWSNAASTPIIAAQDRALQELLVHGAVTMQLGAHELKAGADAIAGDIREQFAYQITDAAAFEPDTRPRFQFDARRADREQSLFVQDRIAWGRWTIAAGLRWDRYQLAIADHAFSPRAAVAWSWPAADLVLRSSYDRVYQTPAVENLLLASSPALDAVRPGLIRLPVPPSRGHFYEAAASKGLFARVRLDVSHFRRTMADVADDDVLLNTGVSFPIAFRRADIHGTEVRVEVADRVRLSGYLSYSHLHGVGELPVTGGLFLGEDTDDLDSRERFPLTQDQRHTIRARASYRFARNGWIAMAASYGSGLPFEDVDADEDADDAIEQFGARVVERVDFARGRVKPSFSLDASAGVLIARRQAAKVSLQAEVRNLTDRLDVINFSGLFSGTALAAPRSLAVRLRAEF